MAGPVSLPVADPGEAAPGGASAAVKAQLRLREMILSGELAGGTRIAELTVVEMLGVSRTPVRSALMRLEQEGLLDPLPNGGYAVRSFSEQDIGDAIELRGVLEGLTARRAAEAGVAPVLMSEARACLQAIDALFDATALSDEAFSRYVEHNERFHALLSEMADSAVIAKELGRVTSLPFASASGFVAIRVNAPQSRDMLIVAQDQHWQVLDAIEHREGARAEAIMREHSRIARRNLRAAVHHAALEELPPGIRMIRRPNARRAV
jgi:GntR family transcriptional regulator of vanillate catabolism